MPKQSNQNRVYLGTRYPARDEAVTYLLSLPVTTPDRDTRSPWYWIRLANGDLILGFYPQGDEGYTGTEVWSDDWQRAERDGTEVNVYADLDEMSQD